MHFHLSYTRTRECIELAGGIGCTASALNESFPTKDAGSGLIFAQFCPSQYESILSSVLWPQMLNLWQ